MNSRTVISGNNVNNNTTDYSGASPTTVHGVNSPTAPY